MGDGDGWVHCAAGHRHWGRFGAAGLLIADGQRAVLQHRAPWTHEGGTWGLPGGARDSREDSVTTALREAAEEAEIAASAITPTGIWVDDHGGWSYTTVLASPRGPVSPRAANAESTEVRWWPRERIAQLPLHEGLAASWPQLCAAPPPLCLVVDAANVVGARPDGWWRDRLGAARRLRRQLGALARAGVPAADLPRGLDSGGLSRLLPHVVMVVEGAAGPAAADPPDPRALWWDAALRVHAAPADGDTEIAQQAAAGRRAGAQVVVVTADRGLRDRLPAGAVAVGPTWLWTLVGS